MITVIVKKEILPKWISITTAEDFKCKNIKYFLYIIKHKLKGYEVGILNEKEVK